MKENPADSSGNQILRTVFEAIVVALLFFGLTKSYLAHRGKFRTEHDDADSARVAHLAKDKETAKNQKIRLSAAEIRRAGIKAVNLKDFSGNTFRIPNSAVVWKNGQAFVFISNNSNEFRMVGVNYQLNGWVSSSLSKSNAIQSNALVIKGAGLLLSEQYRSRVKEGDND